MTGANAALHRLAAVSFGTRLVVKEDRVCQTMLTVVCQIILKVTQFRFPTPAQTLENRDIDRTPHILYGVERDNKEPPMTIEIHDTALEARIQKQIQATGAASAEEALLRLLETQEEQDRWLLENREEINAKIRRGIEQLDRGEGIPEDQLDAYLAELKAQPE